jgi:hypothetical protein
MDMSDVPMQSSVFGTDRNYLPYNKRMIGYSNLKHTSKRVLIILIDFLMVES